MLLPSHVRISRAINIGTVADSVWNQVDDLRKWESWNPFFNNLAAKRVTYLDTAGGKLNAVKVESTTIRWKEKNTTEHIAEMLSGNRLPLMSGWKCMHGHQTNSNTLKDSLTLQWYMDFHLRWYPWEKFASLMLENSYGIRMEQGLTNLKELLEK